MRVAAATLNFNDVDGVRGRYRTVSPPLPYTPGMEVLGFVEGAGAGAEAWLGKRVVAVPGGAFGGYAELAVGPSAMAFEMPPESQLPDTAAAAVYFPFHLSWLALQERARLQAGETVLIHAAAGGVGSAALQLAVLAGARVIATAGSAEKVDLCRSLGADVAINYLESDFVEAVLSATDGRGVDVAFDSVGGDVTIRTFRCMAFNGRHLLVGFASGIEAEDEGIVPRPVLFGNFSLYGVCLAYADDPFALKQLSSYNFPSHTDGVRIHYARSRTHPCWQRAADCGQCARLRRPAERTAIHGGPPDCRAHRCPRDNVERLRRATWKEGSACLTPSGPRHARSRRFRGCG